jgi:hypothetical protein
VQSEEKKCRPRSVLLGTAAVQALLKISTSIGRDIRIGLHEEVSSEGQSAYFECTQPTTIE